MSAITIDQEVQRRRQEYIQQAMLEVQRYDMIYVPHMPAYVDYLPALRGFWSMVVKRWQHLFSMEAVQAGQLAEPKING